MKPNAGHQARREAGARQLGKDKAQYLTACFLILPVENRTCGFPRIRRSTCGPSPWQSMQRPFPFLQLHRACPVDSSRGRWGPLFPSAQRRGACAGSPHPGGRGFPTCRLLRPLRPLPATVALHPGAPPSSCPLAFLCFGRFPVFSMENAHGTMAVACCSPGPVRSLRLPSLWTLGRSGVPRSPWPPSWCAWVHTRTARVCFLARLADMSAKVCQGQPFPKGFPTLQVMHHVVPQPSATSRGLGSPSWRLAGACCSHPRVVEGAELQGLNEYLYTQRCYHILPYRFTAHQA